MLKSTMKVVVLCLGLCGFVMGTSSQDEPKPAVELRVGVVLDSSPTAFRFTATNNGKEEIHTSELGTNTNRIVFITPGGKEVQVFVYERMSRGMGLVEIAQSQSKTWDLEINKAMAFRKLADPGWYGLYWSFEGVKSNTLWFYRAEPETKRE